MARKAKGNLRAPINPKAEADEVPALVDQAGSSDENTAVAATRELARRFPDIMKTARNLAESAEDSLLNAMAGKDFFSREV